MNVALYLRRSTNERLQADSLKVVDRARHFAALASVPITDEDYDDLARSL